MEVLGVRTRRHDVMIEDCATQAWLRFSWLLSQPASSAAARRVTRGAALGVVVGLPLASAESSMTSIPAHPGHPGGESFSIGLVGMLLVMGAIFAASVWRLARQGRSADSDGEAPLTDVDGPLVQPASRPDAAHEPAGPR
jgi:hypothetical protein